MGASAPGAEYVSQAHTLEHFRDFWYPNVFERSNFDPLAGLDSEHLAKRLSARSAQLLTDHHPQPIGEGVDAALTEIERSWRHRTPG
jgi:trimethylamine--corrinoid protein Co-methyltransferase